MRLTKHSSDYGPMGGSFPQSLPVSTMEIPLTRGMVAIVDAEDYERLNAWKWYLHKGNLGKCYAETWAGNILGKVKMHHMVLPATEDKEVDHRDGNGLNNTRSNLIHATHQQNTCNTRIRSDNTSGVKGVSWDKVNRRWAANIRVNGKSIKLGRFDRKSDAAEVYRLAAIKYFGDFARCK